MPLNCKELYSYLSDVLTTILSVSSRTFLVLLHNAKADEWENITGASLASIVSLDVFRELCDRSIIMPSRFSSFITVYCKMKNIYTLVAIVTLSLSHCLQFHLHFLCTLTFSFRCIIRIFNFLVKGLGDIAIISIQDSTLFLNCLLSFPWIESRKQTLHVL